MPCAKIFKRFVLASLMAESSAGKGLLEELGDISRVRRLLLGPSAL